MWEAKVGMQVVCISEGWQNYPNTIYPKKDQILTIRSIRPGNLFKGHENEIFLMFEEIINPEKYWEGYPQVGKCEKAFNANRFRPLSKTNIDELIAIAKKPPKELIKSNTPKWDRQREKVKEDV